MDIRLRYGLTFISGLAVGVGGAYLATSHFLKKGFEKELEKVDADWKEYSDRRVNMIENSTTRAAKILLEDQGYVKVETEESIEVEEEVVGTTLKACEIDEEVEVIEDYPEEQEPDDNGYVDPYVLADEIDNRMIDIPYIITKDEFFEDDEEDGGYRSVTLEYYAGDHILVDEKEEPIPRKESMVGTNLDSFGHGSGDPNIVYVRNDRIQVNFEICYNPGHYSREVLGFVEHSEGRAGVRKFRSYD